MAGKRDDGAGHRRSPAADRDDAVRRVKEQIDREDEFDRSMNPKPEKAADAEPDEPTP